MTVPNAEGAPGQLTPPPARGVRNVPEPMGHANDRIRCDRICGPPYKHDPEGVAFEYPVLS
jgi:hypothetical protein